MPKFPNTKLRGSTVYHWLIPNFSRLPIRATSPTFECGGFKWQLLMHPQGNPSSTRKGSIAFFLNCLGPVDGSREWHACAAFVLELSNPNHPQVKLTQQTQHRFTPKVYDWGYDEFVRVRSAFVPSRGQPAPLIGKDPESGELTVLASVAVDVLHDETGVLWHDFQDYNSKQATGYTGLVNQGATCYLNSLIQSLYFTKAFRNAVYQIPDTSGVTGGLQRLFYQLRTSNPPVDTNDLTGTFGWNTADAFTQHDVQELARILMDRLEAKMKDTEVDGFLSKLFVGQMVSYIRCINVPFESSVTENFWDIQLNVKGMKNVYESFDDYCSVETLEGDNQYAAGEYGLQDAVKGVKFDNLPPVLHLQLKRYDYNWEQNTEVKVNDRYEFPLDLDLEKYVEQKGEWKYALHGVLVHSGDLNIGHYYALIKPEQNSGWFKFDDDRVTKASMHEVLEENYGCSEGTLLRRVTSAYMLVYIRLDSLDFVLPGENDAQPPIEITRMVEAEQRADEMKRKDFAEQKQAMRISVFNNENFKYHLGRGYFSRTGATRGIGDSASLSLPRPLRTRTGLPFSALYRDLNAQSLFLSYRTADSLESTRGPSECMIAVPNSRELGWSSLRERARDDIPVVYIAPDFPESELSQAEYKLLFIKMFDEQQNAPRGIGAFWVPNTQPLIEFFAMKIGIRCSSLMLEVVTEQSGSDIQSLVLPVESINSPQDLLLKDADILIVARDCERVKEYFDGVRKRVTLQLTPYINPNILGTQFDDVGRPSAPGNPAGNLAGNQVVDQVEGKKVELTVSITDDYAVVASAVAAAVNAKDYLHIQLHTAFPRWSPDTALHSNVHPKYIWSQTQATVLPLQYRVLDIPLPEFEQLLEVGVCYLPEGTMGQRNLHLFRGKSDEVLTVAKIAAKVGIDASEQARMKNWAVKFHRNVVEIHERNFKDLDTTRKNLYTIFSTVLPVSEFEACKVSDKKCEVIHFAQDPLVPHGIPFMFTLLPRETFDITKKRLTEMLDSVSSPANAATLNTVKFAFVNVRTVVPRVTATVPAAGQEKIVLYDLIQSGMCLGLIHPIVPSQELQSQALHID